MSDREPESMRGGSSSELIVGLVRVMEVWLAAREIVLDWPAESAEATELLGAGLLAQQANHSLLLVSGGKKALIALLNRGVESMRAEAERLAGLPSYHEGHRVLWWHDLQIKCFGREAGRQLPLILAFEKEGWKKHIANPFTEEPGRSAQEVLSRTITDINRGLLCNTIRFRRGGNGGVMWEEKK
jgi:hypothetical protein